ncbi:MAG: sigma 54-interacting transcriptional regulator [Planctomycetes bacterium]|nr:sigma 54-interacting transcriptional regulator [Planctomycetota bacterium]
MPYLRIEKGPQAGEVFELREAGATIGRERDNDVHLMDETASRHHSRVVADGGAWFVEDLGSANGTLVNGERTPRKKLDPGDRIRVGATTLSYEEDNRCARETVVVGPETEKITVIRRVREEETDPLRPAEGEDTQKRLSRLSRIVAAGRDCHGALEPEEFVERLHQALARDLAPDRAHYELLDARGKTVLARTYPPGRSARARAVLSTAVREAVLSRREAVLIECRREDARFADRLSLAEADVSTALAVPFVREGALLGLAYLDRLGSGKEPFGEDDLRQVAQLAGHLAGQLAGTLKARAKEDELKRLRLERETGGALVGGSPVFTRVFELVEKVAPTDSSVLLVGETGTGKEVVARTIHARSGRAQGPFVAVNCAAIPEDLVESEFFGHEKGAFTGAVGAKKGKLQLANGGTIFLDEVGDIPVHLQTKLLRAIEERAFYPVGADREATVDVRVLAATNRDLAGAIQDGSFRKDLYYRIGVFTILIPPLRERAGDVRLLVEHFIDRVSRSLGREARAVSTEAMKLLESYSWPGNVRELKNAIERALILCEGPELQAADLPGHLAGAGPGSPLSTKRILTLREAEELAIRRALEFVDWKKGEAVKLLGTTWPTLNKKIQDYGILPPR